jgi:putative nucleotidyltransferase with HDIG domain
MKKPHKANLELDKLRQVSTGILAAFAKIVETHDPFTMGHQNRVAQLATAIGEELGLPYEQIEILHVAGNIHDIGKINIPAEILCKPAQLNQSEFDIVKDHPKTGYNILNGIEFPWPIAQIVLQHHEKKDGSGYPYGLTEKSILPEAKILAVADVVEAMTNPRSYRKAKSIEDAMDFLSQKVDVLYNPNIVVACQNVFVREKFQFV